MRIGVLTGGGDCPGLNAAIRAVVKYASRAFDDKIVGIRYGWKGFVDETLPREKRITPLSKGDVSGILVKGGTILFSSRTNPLKEEHGLQNLKINFDKLKLDGLIAIGGEDTLSVAYEGFRREGLPVVGIPKTIDNDLYGTDATIGFSTACDIATEAIDRLHSTAESHDRIIIVEVMGRHTGWIAVRAGIAGGADAILIPEFPMTVDEVCGIIRKRQERGKNFSIIVVAEGYKLADFFVTKGREKDTFDHELLGGVAERLTALLRERTGGAFEIRANVLGHLQRGGSPNSYDRVLATRFGKRAVDLVHSRQFGRMAAIRGYDIIDVELKEAVGVVSDEERHLRTVPQELFETAKVFFG